MNYLIKTKGLFTTKAGGLLVSKPFTEGFVLQINDQQQALSVIKKTLIDDRLRNLHDNYRYCRTCEIVSISETEAESEETELSVLLSEAVKLECIPQNLNLYTSDEQKIQALTRAIRMAKVREKKKLRASLREQEDDVYN